MAEVGKWAECSGLARSLAWPEHGTATGQGGLCLVDVILPLAHLAPSLQGVITVKGLVDREKGDFYTLTVVADDGGPKVDSTVVSGSLGESPAGAVTAPKHPKPTSSPATQHAGQAVGEGLIAQGQHSGHLPHTFPGSLGQG